jgi:hypothetical protein
MKKLMAVIAVCFLVAGCSWITYTNPDGSSVSSKVFLQGADKYKMKTGTTSIEVNGIKTDAEILGATIGAAVKAAK